MTKRVLVVDNGINDCQYMIVEFEGYFKSITRYRCIPCQLHSDALSKIIVDIFKDNECDEIYMDIMGTSMCLYEALPQEIRDLTYGYKMYVQGNHERLCNLITDFNNTNIFIDIDSIQLYDVIKFLGNEQGIYRNDVGLMKISKYIDDDTRKKLHMILGMYCNK